MNLNKKIGSRDAQRRGFLLIGWQICFTALCIFLSMQKYPLIWLCGQVLFGICLLQWFVIEHDLAHGGFLKGKLINVVLGHIASVFCLLPYFPWKQLHHSHHVWTGWKKLDPTLPAIHPDNLPRFMIRFMDFCWRYWIPIFAFSFSLQKFWNYRLLKKLYPGSKSNKRNLFSILFLITVYSVIISLMGTSMLRIWLPAFLIYLSIADLLLLSQHTHLDYNDPGDDSVKPIRYLEQPVFTRSVIYPKVISKYILYYSDKHGLHHQHPGVPFYYLSELTPPQENSIYWLDWLKIAKKMPAHNMIFHSYSDTGIKL